MQHKFALALATVSATLVFSLSACGPDPLPGPHPIPPPCADKLSIGAAGLPAAANNYLTANHNSQRIDDAYRLVWDSKTLYAIELENDLELLFSENGDFISSGYDREDKNIRISDLPASIKSYIGQNFPNNRIEDAETDREFGIDYIEVELISDTYVIFDQDGNFLCVREGDDDE